MTLNEAIPPSDYNPYWDMFTVDIVRMICYQTKAQSVKIYDKRIIVDKQTNKVYTPTKNGG